MLAGLPLGQAALLPTPRKTPLVMSGGYHLLGCAAFVGYNVSILAQFV